MSDKTTAYASPSRLTSNDGATAAAVELINAACGSAAANAATHVLDWAIRDDNLNKLRDKIKESAAST